VAKTVLPYPPLELANRVGSLADAADPFAYYDKLGLDTRNGIAERLPSDWTFAGKRVLDFGCGAGRTLRHFSVEATEAEFWGCDIDETSIEWMEQQMCPPFHAFVNDAEPPLEQADASFDLIWAISVFTHLTYSWSRWLLELHRVLKPDGLLFVTFMGRGMSEEIAGDTWNDRGFGMNVIKYGQSWDLGGPMVIHSPWWIEEHWGRAFEILSLSPDGFAGKPWLDHGTVLMRKRDQLVDPEELERIDPGETRELSALSHNVEQLHRECFSLREGLEYQSTQLEDAVRQKNRLDAELKRSLDDVKRSLDDAYALRNQATDLHRKARIAQTQAASAREQSMASARTLLEVEEILAQSKARIFALEEAVGELQPQLERAEHLMAAMRKSVGWRITAPLRALKRLH
jgi:SAM-dependent methyltransferase